MAMNKASRHVIPHSKDGWSVRASGAASATKVFAKQEQAVKYARDLARKEKTDLYVHAKDGSIREMSSYGRDPLPPKDKK